MGSVVLLFLFAALALFLLGCKEGIILLKKRNRICKTTGRIVDVSTLAAETMKVYNSKWALVMYSVDGRMITSQNRIVVPMSSNVGDPVDIQYDTPRFDIAVNHPCKKICFILPSDEAFRLELVFSLSNTRFSAVLSRPSSSRHHFHSTGYAAWFDVQKGTAHQE